MNEIDWRLKREGKNEMNSRILAANEWMELRKENDKRIQNEDERKCNRLKEMARASNQFSIPVVQSIIAVNFAAMNWWTELELLERKHQSINLINLINQIKQLN